MAICILTLAGCIFSMAADIREVAIELVFAADGSARVTERWDVDVDTGTEWYLAKYNLGAISLQDFSVTDESGMPYSCEGPRWDTDRSLSQKAGRCGLVVTNGGYELCWGLGSYGHHIYTASYLLKGAVQAMDDYDCFHMQLVSPGLSSRPQKVSVRAAMENGTALDERNCRIWGFGFEGEAVLKDGGILYYSTESFTRNSSVISLIRFDKGLFNPSVTRGGSFESVLSRALEGSSYGQEDSNELVFIILFCVLFVALLIFIAIAAYRSNLKNILGVTRKRDIQWCRDVPYGGEVLAADYILSKLESGRGSSIVAGAMILRMIEKHAIEVGKGRRGKVELAFGDAASLDGMPQSYRQLWDMMKEASGTDRILQDKEFSRWSEAHTARLDRWNSKVRREGGDELVKLGYMTRGGKFNDDARAQARNLLGLKKFLKDFTLIDERGSAEVGLWNDYLVFGSLFGIADKVAGELHDINPQVFEQTVYQDMMTTRSIILLTRNLGYAITNASAAQQAKAASAGMGGHTSFGGGGGFSGGGFGGGAR